MQKANQIPKITVVIRKRPLNKKQIQKNETDIITVRQDASVVVSQYKLKVDLTKYIEQTTFNFDYAFDEYSANEQIYECSIKPLIKTAFMGAKISCFAYGQTGSGKTHTMKGDLTKGIPGLYFLGAQQIFDNLKLQQFNHLKVNVTFYEIYCGKLYDLLANRTELKIRQDKNQNINVIGMQQKEISSAEDFIELIQYGSNFRVTSQNATNADSSRSHAILQISLKDGKKIFSKISFIDLAGNERGADHMDMSKQTRVDGAQINKSLLSLKECIRALDSGKGHIPFRGSKLTMILKDSFVGFCKTVMIGNVSPNQSSSENTMNTLRYADRVKDMKKPNQNGTSCNKNDMMLPRDNKNAIKIMIEKGDDEQDIRLKKQMAKKVKQRESKKENKMDIEQPSPQMAPEPRKRLTDPLYNDIHSYHQKVTQNMNNKRNQSRQNRRTTGGQSMEPIQNYSNVVIKPHQKLINLFPNNVQNTRTSTNTSLGVVHSSSNNIIKPNQVNFGNNGVIMNHSQNFGNAKHIRLDENDSNLQNQERNAYFNDFKIADPRINYQHHQPYQPHTSQNRPIGNAFNNGFPVHFQPEYGPGPNFGHSKVNYQHRNHENEQRLRNFRRLNDDIHNQMSSFQSNHRSNIELQAGIMRNQAQLLQSFENRNLSDIDYVMQVEQCIDQKLNFLNNMRRNLSFLRDRVQERNQVSRSMPVSHQSFGDQQLLEGLPGDQIGAGRLF